MKKNISREEEEILDSPIFVVGSGRSGTTWLQKLLLEHPQIAGGQESEFFIHFSSCLSSIKSNKKSQRKLGLSVYWDELELHDFILDAWRRTFLSMLRQKPQATLLAEKTPNHALYMNEIAQFLPHAKFIHIIRDSRAVVASMRAAEKGWGKSWAPRTTTAAAAKWKKSIRKALSSGRNMSPDKYIEVHYEDLLANTPDELAKIYSFLNLQYDSNLLETVIKKQGLNAQKSVNGSGFLDYRGDELNEPDGFFRKGKSNSWKQDLNLFQKIITWLYTRHLMKVCGYSWAGRTSLSKR